MARERVNTSSSTSSGIAEDCSSSSSSEDTSSTSSSSAFSSSTSSTGSISRASTRSTSSKRSRRRSFSLSRGRTDRKNNSSGERANYERPKKRIKVCSKRSSHGKHEKKKQKKDSKKRKHYLDVEHTKQVSSGKEKKRGSAHEVQVDSKANDRSNNLLEVALNAQEQQKALIRHNAELAKARLESGELQKAREEQKKMHQLYGTVDWRVTRKLRTEKKRLERTVAAGKSLASLEQREYARMDAFRVALGLPTAEAQRQAEWRREQTQALVELESSSKPTTATSNNKCKKAKQSLIGPMLPH